MNNQQPDDQALRELLSSFFQRQLLQQLISGRQREANVQFFPLNVATSATVDFKDGEREFFEFVAKERGIKSDLTPMLLLSIQKSCLECKDGIASIDAIAAEFLRNGTCPCLQGIQEDDAKRSVKHIWLNLDCPCECDFVMAVLEYELSSGNLPTNEELQTFLQNRRHISAEPDDYCNNKRHHVPTPGIDNLKAFKVKNKDMACSICLCAIAKGLNIYKLPQCGHTFHAEEKDCLENASILTWLKKSRFCPNCNAEISVTACIKDSLSPKRKHDNKAQSKDLTSDDEKQKL